MKRPRIRKGGKLWRVVALLPEELEDRLRKLSIEKQISMAQILREALQKYLEKKED